MRTGNTQSRRALRLIREWAILHRSELETNWASMKAGKPLDKIAPLESVDIMTYLPSVVSAEYRGGFRILRAFSDNSDATLDFQQWLDGPVFEPLKDRSYFQRFFIDGGTVVWPNGADIAPETLYEAVQATRSNPAQQPTAPARVKCRG